MSRVLRFPEGQSRRPDFRKPAVAEALPSYYVAEYPNFVKFIQAYYDYIKDDEGFGDLLNKLTDARDLEVAAPELLQGLKNEYGPEFPDLGTVNPSTLIRLFQYWYKAKGSSDAVKQYFRLFLNTDAEVVFPGDSILRVSDGQWSDDEQRYLTQRSHLSDPETVLQDSYFYQIFSYLIRTEISIIDWGPAFEALAHPAGWIFFGEVRITELATFDYQTFSPTRVPGRQTLDSSLLLFGMAAMAFGASAQTIVKTWRKAAAESFETHSMEDVGINFLASTYPLYAFADTPVEDLISGSPAIRTKRRRPARITITTTP